jgi:hypothetical protein
MVSTSPSCFCQGHNDLALQSQADKISAVSDTPVTLITSPLGGYTYPRLVLERQGGLIPSLQAAVVHRSK